MTGWERLEEDMSLPSPLHRIHHDLWEGKKIELLVKRDDLIHPYISGNKWRKLRYNLKHVLDNKMDTIISFGGAFSNHLVALATSANACNVKSIGLIRGHSIDENNPTIRILRRLKMELHFLRPDEYRELQNDPEGCQNLTGSKNAFIVPPGGSNQWALPGVHHIWDEVAVQSKNPINSLVLAVGTGGTLAGLSECVPSETKIFGIFPFNKKLSEFLGMKWLSESRKNIYLHRDKLGIRFGKFDKRIPGFIDSFYRKHGILMDPIYTARAMMTLLEWIHEDRFEAGSRILFYHSGGLQGIAGYNYLHGTKSPISIPASYTYLINPSIIRA